VISESKGEKNMTAHQPGLGQFRQLFFCQSRAQLLRKYFLKLSMATALGKNAPKYGALHKSCGIKYAVKLQQKYWQKRTAFFCAIYLMLLPLRKVQTGW